jgi:hypothetical protein
MSKADLEWAYELTRRLEARGMGLFNVPPKREAGRPRLYQTEAEKKKAYRERRAGRSLVELSEGQKRSPEKVTDMEISKKAEALTL